MITLADALSDVAPQTLKDVLMVFAALLAVAGGVLALTRKMPQPFRTREDKEYATASGVQVLAQRVEALEKDVRAIPASLARELSDLRQELSEDGETRVVAIHSRIEPLAASIHEQRGTLAEISRAVHELTNAARARRT